MGELKKIFVVLFVLSCVTIFGAWCLKCTTFDLKSGYRNDGNYRAIPESSMLSCTSQCLQDKTCQSANFNHKTHVCELTERSGYSSETNLTATPNWVVLNERDCYNFTSSEIETFEETTCGSHILHKCHHGYVAPATQQVSEILSCGQINTSLSKKCVAGTCKDILKDRPDAGTGQYTYKDPNGTEVAIFCDFRGNHGYTFFSSGSLSNLSSLYPHLTTSSEAVIRHFRTNDSQTEATMKILSRYRNQYNLTFLLNDYFYNPVNEPYADSPFLTLGFVPVTFGSRLNTVQGYSVQDIDIEFTSCDSNPGNSIIFFKTPLVRRTKCCASNVKSAWYENGSPVEAERHLPNEFSFKFQIFMGGCGASWAYDDLGRGIEGVSLGLKFYVDDK